MLKKIGVILSLMAIVLLTFGNSFYHLYIRAYKKDFKDYILTHANTIQTSKIIVQKEKINDLDISFKIDTDDDEIFYNGVLYDVVSKEYCNNEIIFTVVADNKDTEMTHEYSVLFEEEDERNENETSKILKQFLALKYIGTSTIEVQYLKTNSNQISFIEINYHIKKVFLSQETPPPNYS